MTDFHLRDVEREAATIDLIEPYLRRSAKSVRDLRSQRRLRRLWEQERDRLSRRLRADPADLDTWRLERVRALVDKAFATVPFYRELYAGAGFEPGDIVTWDDFRALPTVNKQMMVEADVPGRLRAAADGRTLHSARTSGSSGLNITILQDNASVDYRTLLHMRDCDMDLSSPLRPDDWRYSVFFASERYTSLAGAYPFVTVSEECPPDLLLRHLATLRPRMLAAFPSYLQRLAGESADLAQLGVEVVYTNSERSTREERVKYSQVFGVPVLDEYSSEEMSLIAYECHERRYHLVEDSAYLELEAVDPAGYGSLVGTSLGNFLMPFIRYDQGDLLRFSEPGETCGCGSRFRMIAGFRGREDEHLRDGQVRKVPADVVLGLCDRTLVEAPGLRQYQIAQVAPDLVELRIQRADPAGPADDRALLDTFVTEFPTLFRHVVMRVAVREVAAFPTFASGKRRLVHLEGDWARG